MRVHHIYGRGCLFPHETNRKLEVKAGENATMDPPIGFSKTKTYNNEFPSKSGLL